MQLEYCASTGLSGQRLCFGNTVDDASSKGEVCFFDTICVSLKIQCSQMKIRPGQGDPEPLGMEGEKEKHH